MDPEAEGAIRRGWQRKLALAKEASAARQAISRDLIEIAAQHPLVGGTEPGEEFAARLLRGAELFGALRDSGRQAEIYVPGSRFMDDGIEDAVTLSAAGTKFLAEHGIPAEVLHGDDLNERYKGAQAAQPGVYCSADECFVAASYWRDGGFGRLLSVVSAGQALRKMLHFIEFGVYPLIYTVPTAAAANDPIHEAMTMIPSVIFEDPDLQRVSSRLAVAFREQRMPGCADAG